VNIFSPENTSNNEVMLSSYISHLQEVLEKVGDCPVAIGDEYPHPPASTALQPLPSMDESGRTWGAVNQ